jgi:hypothetical protein
MTTDKEKVNEELEIEAPDFTEQPEHQDKKRDKKR